MGFLDMGTMEILLILAVALIIWGPAKIPEIARTLGKTMRALRKATLDLTTAVTKEINIEEEKNRPSKSKADDSDKAKEPLDANEAKSSGTEMPDQKDQ